METKEEIKAELKKTKAQLAKERAKRNAKEFGEEFTKAIKTAFLAAFGFLIALVWRDLITEFVNGITGRSPIPGRLLGAIITTMICVIGIFIFIKIFPEKKKDGKKTKNILLD